MQFILSLIGTAVTVAMCVNAFFLRGIFQDLNSLRVELARIVANSDIRKEQMVKMDISLDDLLKEMERTRFRLHKLAGGQTSLFALFKDLEEEIDKK